MNLAIKIILILANINKSDNFAEFSNRENKKNPPSLSSGVLN